MNASQTEAIAQADAYTSNAALPTYSELVEALRASQEHINGGAGIKSGNAFHEMHQRNKALLDRIAA